MLGGWDGSAPSSDESPPPTSRTMSTVLGTKSSRIDRLELSTVNTATDDDLHITLSILYSADDAWFESLHLRDYHWRDPDLACAVQDAHQESADRFSEMTRRRSRDTTHKIDVGNCVSALKLIPCQRGILPRSSSVNSQHQTLYQPIALTYSGAPTPKEEDDGTSEADVDGRDEGRLGTSVRGSCACGQMSLTEAENNRNCVWYTLAACPATTFEADRRSLSPPTHVAPLHRRFRKPSHARHCQRKDC
jgi:hypothetical protein